MPRMLMERGAKWNVVLTKSLTLGLVLVLGGCDQAQGPNAQEAFNAQNQTAYGPAGQQPNPFATNPPASPNGPAPYTGSTPGGGGGSPWPGAQPAQPGQPGQPATQPGIGLYVPGSGSGASTPSASGNGPQGMTRIPSQAGHVFRAQLGGSTAPVPQVARDYYNRMVTFFDQPPQVLGHMDAPDGSMSQVGFQATKGGAPVMAMMVVMRGPNGNVATLLMDSPERFEQSMPHMMQAAGQ